LSVIEILHAILNIAAGDGAQQWLHDEIDKIEDKPEPAPAEAEPVPAATFASPAGA